jgi:hypothetical protein
MAAVAGAHEKSAGNSPDDPTLCLLSLLDLLISRYFIATMGLVTEKTLLPSRK